MSPLRWFRWKVVAVLAAAVGIFYYLGLDAIALKEVNHAGKTSDAARWRIGDLGIGLVRGALDLEDLLVATPERRQHSGKAATGRGAGGAGAGGDTVSAEKLSGEEKVFNALGAGFDLSTFDLLRGRCVVDRISISAPKVNLSRREDGTLNVEDLGGGPAEDAGEKPEEAWKPADWYEGAKKVYERLQKLREHLGGKDEESGAPGEDSRPGGAERPAFTVDYSRGATYPFAGRPGFLVHTIEATGLEIAFADAAAASPLPPLTNGRIAISEVSSRPTVQEEATGFEVSGDIAGSRLSLAGTVDFRKDARRIDLKASSGKLPAALVAQFVGASLPVRLESGTIAVDAVIALDGLESLEVVPRLELEKLRVEAKDPGGKIAGLDAARFARGLNEASRTLDRVVIADLRITGSLALPRLEWGDSIRTLVLEGASAFAAKYGEEAVEKGKAVLEKEIGKAREKLSEELGKSGAGKELEETLKGIEKDVPEAGGEAAKKGLDLLKDGIFGGKKKEKEGAKE
jgi:hypothetical protein